MVTQWALEEKRDPGVYPAPWVEVAKKDFVFFIWRFLYNYLLQLTWVDLSEKLIGKLAYCLSFIFSPHRQIGNKG